MAFSDDLQIHIEKIRQRIPHIKGEEATKQSLIVPLLHVLGYDIFDPREIRPEYIADFAIKKAGQFEKIDYALCQDNKPVIFVECKALGVALEDHGGQLARYFNATPSVKVGVVTDGVKIRVFSDLENTNILDQLPWLNIDLMNLKPNDVDSLRRFRKGEFSSAEIYSFAEEMIYYSKILNYVSAQLTDPSEEMVRFIASEVLPKNSRITLKVIERLAPTIKKAFQSAIVGQVARSLDAPSTETKDSKKLDESKTTKKETQNDGIITTEDELTSYALIEKWIKDIYPDANLGYKDYKGFFSVYTNRISHWFTRYWVQDAPYWVNFRRISAEELVLLVEGFEVSSKQDGTSLLKLPSINDIPKLREAFVLSFERELVSKEESFVTSEILNGG